MYSYKGITTNNLKNISIEFDDHEIIYVGGVSGSGKSSLVFDTIASISENEFGRLTNDNKTTVKYHIEEYGSVLVAATLKQLNFNVNPRSTILTYFGLYQHMANILSYCTGLTVENFSLNGPCRCRSCNGIGYINKIDELFVVDTSKSLEEGPFRCWNASYADFFSQLLHCFCQEKGIDEKKRFGDLSFEEQELLLYGKGDKKYKLSYIAGGRKRTKTSVYIGPIRGMKSDKKDMFSSNPDKYSKTCVCPKCHGSRLIEQISKKKVIEQKDIEFFLTKSMDVIEPLIIEIKKICKKQSVKYSCDCLNKYILACRRLNVSYLNFSRSISTLSGGELQRLRMVQLLLGKLKNLLIVLDEPTGSLNEKEAKSIISIIMELKVHNTVLVVDHNDKLRKIADKAIFLGPKSGIHGGQIISEIDYWKMQKITKILPKLRGSKSMVIPLKSDYVNYASELTIFMDSLNGISGVSGIGKSTILRDILPYQMDNYKYITQKPIKANRSSTVASYTGLMDEVKNYYAAKTQKDRKIFSLTQDGACTKCGGRGIILIGNVYDEQLYIDCEECNGTGYTEKTLSYTVQGLNIYEFLNRSIEEIIESGVKVSKKFDNTVRLLQKLGLSHLSLNQKVNSLSGGENQRIKLSQALGEGRIKVFGLDEPSKGLGHKEILELISVIYENIKEKGKTFVVSEHNSEFLKLCSHVNELKMLDGKVYIENK